MSRIVFLPGEKLDLCVLDKNRHFDKCWQWINSLKITEFMGSNGVFPVPLSKEQEWFDKQNTDDKNINLALETKEKKHIGNIGLHQIDWIARHALAGIMIGEKEEWNKGYATEAEKLLLHHAFSNLNLNRIYAHVVTENTASVKAAEKAGFQKEGVLRQCVFKNNRYYDAFLLGILKEDWKN